MNGNKVLNYYFNESDIQDISTQLGADFNNVRDICILLSKYFASDFVKGIKKDPYEGNNTKLEKLSDINNILKLCKRIDERNKLGISKNALILAKSLVVINEKIKQYNSSLKEEIIIKDDKEINKVVESEKDDIFFNKEDISTIESEDIKDIKIIYDDDFKEEDYNVPKQKKTLDIVVIVLIAILAIMIAIILYKGFTSHLF